MENNGLFSVFYDTVSLDLDMYRPGTTVDEKKYIFTRALQVFSKFTPVIKWISEQTYGGDSIPMKANNIFMYRKIHANTTVEHFIPSHYKIFLETSQDLYTNYMKTLDNLEGHSFIKDDIDRCRQSLSDMDRILCWSNTSILLNQVIEKLDKNKTEIVTFGSPILLPKYNCQSCLNVYHEDDWILGFVNAIYKFDTSSLKRNVVYECLIDTEACSFTILSRDMFDGSSTEPHRCFNKLF